MSSKESFKENANEYVISVEDKHVIDLFCAHERAENRAIKCGCAQCKKRPDTLEKLIDTEVERLTPTNRLDHEEIMFIIAAISNGI